MKASKLLASTVATAAIIGAIGFSYAQTTSGTTSTPDVPKNANETPGPSGTNMNNDMMNRTDVNTGRSQRRMNRDRNNTTGMSDDRSSSTAGTATSSSDNSSVANERVARADRN